MKLAQNKAYFATVVSLALSVTFFFLVPGVLSLSSGGGEQQERNQRTHLNILMRDDEQHHGSGGDDGVTILSLARTDIASNKKNHDEDTMSGNNSNFIRGGEHTATTTARRLGKSKKKTSKSGGSKKGELITEKIFEENPYDASTVTAGTVIDCDVVKLTQDIDCTGISGDDYCLEVLSGSTLDCDGHKLIGPGADNSNQLPFTSGVLVRGVDDGETATIKNCIIEGFDVGLNIVDSQRTSADFTPPGVSIYQSSVKACMSASNALNLGYPAGTAQCCPYRDAIDGITRIEHSQVSNNYHGALTTRANVEFYDVIATENLNNGLRFQLCSIISLEEIYACGNISQDIRYNNGYENDSFITAASGTIRADNLGRNAIGPAKLGPREVINELIYPDSIQSCYIEDKCGVEIL